MAMKKILSWNVNGIRAIHRKGAFDAYLGLEADVLCMQETKAQPEQLVDEILKPAGYHTYFSSAERKGYSGVALYSKEEPNEIEYGMGIEQFDIEGRTIVAHFDEFVVLNHYYPNGKRDKVRLQYKMDFYEACLDFTDHYVKAGKNVIICGDVNTAHKPIDLARPEANEKISGFLPEERAWIDTFLERGYVDTYRMHYPDKAEMYSWWSMQTKARERNVGWRIDYFFVNSGFKSNVKDAFIMTDFTGSDHCPIGIDIEL